MLTDNELTQYLAVTHKSYVLCSGGDDSLALVSEVIDHPAIESVVHIDTGIGVWEDPETKESLARRHVETVCAERNWPLIVLEARKAEGKGGILDPQVYEDLVIEHGFPGDNEFGHRKMYNRLKERCLRMLKRRNCPRKLIGLLAGCRSEESTRRMGNVELRQLVDNRLWINPLHDWTKRDCLDCLKRKGIPRSPCSLKIHKSGECMCGAFAKPGEAAGELKLFFPEFVRWLMELQERVMDRFPWPWDSGPPRWWKDYNRGQQFLDDPKKLFLCHSCEGDSDGQAT